MTLPNTQPNYNQVALKYFLRVMLEQYALGNHRTVWLMIENVKFDDNFATWQGNIDEVLEGRREI